VKHCKQLDIVDNKLLNAAWPQEIEVAREMGSSPEGDFIRFGRYGILSFNVNNGSATYRRTEDGPKWKYRLVDHVLRGN
jgi:hypothetical protein